MRRVLSQQNGFSLLEALIGVVVVSISALAVGYFVSASNQQANLTRMTALLSQKRMLLQNMIASDASWAQTMSHNPSESYLGCMGADTGCSAYPGPYPLSIFDAAGTVVYQGFVSSENSSQGAAGQVPTSQAPELGYNLDGSVCTSQCAVLLSVKWKPLCGPVDPSCRRPLIQISGTFSSPSSKTAINLNKFNFNVLRSALASSFCTGVAPGCGGGAVAACSMNGWSCVNPQTPTCTGAITWTDPSGTGPCTANVTSLLHDTVTSVSSSSPGFSGSASVLCIPGQPNNGLILQPGASCSTSPSGGACGSANNGTFASAPAAQLCSVGNPSAVLATGGSPAWTWTCTAATGAPASCSANSSAANPAVNGLCGSAISTAPASAPAANLCSSGTATAVAGSGPFTWSCVGSGGGSTANCKTLPGGAPGPAAICGTGLVPGYDFSAWPSANLCVTGVPSAVTPSGGFYNGGSTVDDGGYVWTCDLGNGTPPTLCKLDCGCSSGNFLPSSLVNGDFCCTANMAADGLCRVQEQYPHGSNAACENKN